MRGSTFIWFHIRSSYMIYFIYIIYIHLFHGNIWTHNWPAPNVSGFIAQLVRAWHRYREVTGSNPVEVLNFFQASLRNCINCVHNCEDQPSFDFISAVHIWFISYTSFTEVNKYLNAKIALVWNVSRLLSLTHRGRGRERRLNSERYNDVRWCHVLLRIC